MESCGKCPGNYQLLQNWGISWFLPGQEVSVDIPCLLMVFLRCFVLLPSPAPGPSSWLSPSRASQLSCMQGTTHGSRNSGHPAASASVTTGCREPSPSDASSDLAGGPEMWPSPKAHCIQVSADPSHVTSPQHITSAPPGHLNSLPIPISKPWVRVLTQPLAVNRSQCGVKHAMFCPWDGVHLLPIAKTEPELHRAMADGKLKQNLPLTYCICQCCALRTWHAISREKHRKSYGMRSVACNKIRGSGLTNRKYFSAI